MRLFNTPEQRRCLTQIGRGVEKESLRINAGGTLAQSPHPDALGSPLTHASITTDFSEALLEFITPVSTSIDETLGTLEDIHSFVARSLDKELLWNASMPCIIEDDKSIPLARFGDSNLATMKTVYRRGLSHRYGRLMQVISGIHYNFSMPKDWWQNLWEAQGRPGELGSFITNRYLGLIRNFQRYSWLLIYLFGASPALCSTFLRDGDTHGLEAFDDKGHSYYAPYGTSLRLGDLGYQSNAQKGLKVCYNALENYISTLKSAILEPHPAYAEIGVKVDGEYRQLGDGLLQIENEFYSTIRPKRVTESGQAPLVALQQSGIEYVEVRCIDVNPFLPCGIDAEQIRFLDTFLLYCLLNDSPDIDLKEKAAINQNIATVVNRGREPGLMLSNPKGDRPFKQMAAAILSGMEPIADLLDEAWEDSHDYNIALTAQKAKVDDPELTPSARVVREMREHKLPFLRLAMNYSERWSRHFKNRELAADVAEDFRQQALLSKAKQKAIEDTDTVDFDQHLAHYFAQYHDL
ncbi:MAG: glutamate--cysteine ligase [Gammaproteobacteria bacterium]|nr:MAG: glutamate--cysteine ligase [Gammaproteobacteria bacterium]